MKLLTALALVLCFAIPAEAKNHRVICNGKTCSVVWDHRKTEYVPAPAGVNPVYHHAPKHWEIRYTKCRPVCRPVCRPRWRLFRWRCN